MSRCLQTRPATRTPERASRSCRSCHRSPTSPPAARPCAAAPPAVAPDEPHQRGDSALLDAHTLGNIAAHVLSGRLAPADYQSRMLCLTDWRRKGTAFDLAPLAQQFPSTNRPEFKPLPKATFDKAFALQPGGLRLSEAEKGDLLQTNLGGFGTPSTTAASGGAQGAGSAGGGAAAPPAATKIKLKVKASKGEKRRREGSIG
ncbi:expressed protein [Chlorella variabilis]|uniref:Expressed protein n=1 Tax=Chlorella variabilis TaxID=554065 RepID=E1Z442_CHLVA|nr:expressed protein [Chlorella variabilis]EFN59283.1 expressed protein [Chlorella variabilis]|eukprot:XP_005851385.1 expressed protein [Chlorella variabilis]